MDNNDKYTIAEAVDLLKREGFDVSTHKLRQYEKQGLLDPEKSSSNYRLYDDAQLEKIRMNITFVSLGFSIKELKKLKDYDRQTREFFRKLIVRESVERLEKSSEEEITQHLEKEIRKMGKEEVDKNSKAMTLALDFYKRVLERMDKRLSTINFLKERYFHPMLISMINLCLERMRSKR